MSEVLSRYLAFLLGADCGFVQMGPLGKVDRALRYYFGTNQTMKLAQCLNNKTYPQLYKQIGSCYESSYLLFEFKV